VLVAIDGIDAAGKTTQVHELVRRAEGQGLRAVATKEPTDGPVGRLIRRVLSGEVTVSEPALAALFAADRLDHVVTTLLDLERETDVVVCDRFCFSSFGYFGPRVPYDALVAMNAYGSSLLKPDLTLILDTPVETCRRRLAERTVPRELYERDEDLDVIRAGLRGAVREVTGFRVEVVDGTGSVEDVADRVWAAFAALRVERAGA